MSIEKLCMCFYSSCTKLKYYTNPTDVFVYSHFDVIKHTLSKPILHRRIGQWALALIEYSLTYSTLKAVKGQVVANFYVDHAIVEVRQDYVGLKSWKLYFEGSKHKNETSIGILIIPLKKFRQSSSLKLKSFASIIRLSMKL